MSSVSEALQLETPNQNSVKRKRSPMSRTVVSEPQVPNSTYPQDVEKQPLLNELPEDAPQPREEGEKTFLYLGFGSNLAKSTFEGRRGIRPLAQVNVHAPSLELTFDLPGLAYSEPCFANSRKRVTQRKPDGSVSDKVVVAKDGAADVSADFNSTESLGWAKGLVGTVYEVTAADYKQIIQTEGGGASYEDVLVECWTIPRGSKTVPEPDSYPTSLSPPLSRMPQSASDSEKPLPFLAHTLLAPLPDASSHMFRKPNWAQPSQRYLGLLRTGSRERGLPDEYIAWLDNLIPYHITTWRQRIAKYAYQGVWFPFFILLLGLAKLVTDDKGRAPAWWAKLMLSLFGASWWSYDVVFKPLAGEGERTIGT